MGKTKLRPDLFDILKARLAGIRQLLDDMREPSGEEMIKMLHQAHRLFVTGKGRTGRVAECFAMRLMQLGFQVHVPGEATCPRISEGDLMVAISCSGTTVTTVQLARIAHESGARVIAVSAVADSPLMAYADHQVMVPVTGKDVKKKYRYVLGPYNNTLFEEALLLYFDAMVYSILEREGIPKDSMSERHTNLE